MQHTAGSAVDRVVGMVRFDVPTVRRLARDPNGTFQAAIVVGLVSVAFAIGRVDDFWVRGPLLLLLGAIAWAAWTGRLTRQTTIDLDARSLGSWAQRMTHGRSIHAIFGGVLLVIAAFALTLHLAVALVPVLAWLVISGVASFTGQQVFGTPGTTSSFAPVLRAVGFAMAPGVLAILTVIPFLGFLAATVAVVWTFLLITFAIQQTMALTTKRALLTALTSVAVALLTVGPIASMMI